MSISEKLDLILEKLGTLEFHIEQLDNRMDRLESRMDQLESHMDQLESRMDQLEEHAHQLEDHIHELSDTVIKNQHMLEEFYVTQKEFNTALQDRFAIFDGKLEMQGNQIARNTSIIKAYYPSGTSSLAEPA